MHSIETRKRVIENAIQMFNEYGCKAVTMDRFANSIHISKRTLYEMFDNKESLLLECISEVYRTLGNERMEIIKKTEESFLMALFIIRNETTQGIRYARIIKDAAHFYPELTQKLMKKYSDRFKDALYKIFSEAEAKKDLRPDIDVSEIVEIIAMNVRLSRNNPSDSDATQYRRIRESCYTFLRGLLSINAIQRYDQNENLFRKLLEAK